VGTWEKTKGEIPPIELWRKQLAKLSTETEKMSLKRVGGLFLYRRGGFHGYLKVGATRGKSPPKKKEEPNPYNFPYIFCLLILGFIFFFVSSTYNCGYTWRERKVGIFLFFCLCPNSDR